MTVSPGDIPQQGTPAEDDQGMPLHSVNGHHPAARPEPEPLVTPPDQIPPAFGPGPSAMLAALIQQLPQMLADALATALTGITVRTTAQFRCVTCVTSRIGWITANTGALEAGQAKMTAVHEQMDNAHPMKDQLSPLMFLPEGTPPFPPVQDGTVMMQGSVYCPEHVPGAERPGRPSLIVVEGAFSQAAIAAMMNG